MHSMEKSFCALETSYKSLAQSHDLLVLELVRQLACLRSYSGLTLEPQALSQMITQFARCLPADEVHPEPQSILFIPKDHKLHLTLKFSMASIGHQ